MSGKSVAPEAVRTGIEQLDHLLSTGLFMRPIRKVKRS
jgi:hypothetical protein